MNLDGLLTPREAAKILNVSTLTLRNWRITRRNLRFVRKGTRAYYRPEDVEDFYRVYHQTVEVGE